MSPRTLLALALLLHALVPGPAAAGPAALRPTLGPLRIPILRPPAGAADTRWRPDVQLESIEGRQVTQFEPREFTDGLFLAVAGSIEFERIDFAFDDGAIRSVDVFGVVRGRGLYEIATFGETRRVVWVRVAARAISRRAELGLRLAAL